MLIVVALVALCYCGGKYCPAVLRQNKEMLLGGAIALVLSSFFGMRLEGLGDNESDGIGMAEVGAGPQGAENQLARLRNIGREGQLGSAICSIEKNGLTAEEQSIYDLLCPSP